MDLIGLDVGTTGCKAVVFSPDGRMLGAAHREYGILATEPYMAEQDAEHIWAVTCQVIREAIWRSSDNGSNSGRIGALSLSVQGDAIIPIDHEFNAVYNAVLGMDYRSQLQAKRFGRRIGDKRLFLLTGMRPHPINSLIKMVWLKQNRPDAFHRAWKLTSFADFILGKLCGEAVIDHTMASRSMAFDLREKVWSAEILEAAGINPELLSRPVPSGTVVGEVSKNTAQNTELAVGTKLVTGGHDQTCAALGAGVIGEGRAVISTGTAEVLSAASFKPVLNDTMYGSFYPCYLYAKPGMYFTFALNHVGGLLLRWYRDTFAYKEIEEARAADVDPYDQILEKIPANPSGVMILPHFNGSGTPWCDMDSKGAILGLNLSTTRHDIARAILESQSFELKINLETMVQAGIKINELRAVGGGAKSQLWLQIKADILAITITSLKVREAACLGAALLAGTAIGVYPSLDSAVEQTVRVETKFAPDKDSLKNYTERFTVYREVYPTLTALNHKL